MWRRGDPHGISECNLAASILDHAVDLAFEDGSLIPTEFGGAAGTKTVTDAVVAHLGDGSARKRAESSA